MTLKARSGSSGTTPCPHPAKRSKRTRPGGRHAAIVSLKALGATRVRLLCIIGSPEGVAVVQGEHPDVEIILAARDERLNDHGYIVPGLGDAGDRIYGTR